LTQFAAATYFEKDSQKIILILAATLRGSRPGVQSASLYDNFGKLRHYDVIEKL